MRVAVIGCGHIAASYARLLPYHPELGLIGAWDRNPERLSAFTARWKCRPYSSQGELLSDPKVDTVLNLTNPRSHTEVTRAALEAGKHVYSEKPLSMTKEEARDLVELARTRGLMLASAPCSVLSETAQTVSQALRSRVIGSVRLVYANFDEGIIGSHLSPWTWCNEVGVPWPAKDEFEVGCTYEHAGYLLTWLADFFGPALHVTSFASCQVPDKGIVVDQLAPDFSVGCIEYRNGVVARLTCSLAAPRDKSLTIIGDEGVLNVKDVRNERCPVKYRKYKQGRLFSSIERRIDSLRVQLGRTVMRPGWTSWRRYPYVARPPVWLSGHKPVDFLRGPSEMAAALRDDRQCRLDADTAVHIVEIIRALQYPESNQRHRIESSFAADHFGSDECSGSHKTLPLKTGICA